MKMRLKQITFDYDEKADVLYLSFGEPKAAVTEEIGNVGLRVDEKSREIVGITILEFIKSFRKRHMPIRVSVPKKKAGA